MKQKILNYFADDYELFFIKYLSEINKIGDGECSAICPFHEDTNPSFNFNRKSGLWYCHGCSKKGDIFHFYANFKGLDTNNGFDKILKGVCDDFGIPWNPKGQKKATDISRDKIFMGKKTRGGP